MIVADKWLTDSITAPDGTPEDRPKRLFRLNTQDWEVFDPSRDFVEETIRATSEDFMNSSGKPIGKFCTLEYVSAPMDYIQIAYASDASGGGMAGRAARVVRRWRLDALLRDARHGQRRYRNHKEL